MSAPPNIVQRNQSSKPKGVKAILALPFMVSVVFHVIIFLFVGTVVIFQGQVPVSFFDSFDSSAYEAGDEMVLPPLMEEEALMEDVPLDEPLEEIMPEPDNALDPDMGMEIISSTALSTTPTFTVPIASSMSVSPAEIAPPKKDIKPPKRLQTPSFDTVARKSSRVNFFNIKQTTSRVIIAVDISGSMINPDRGGFASYAKLKQEVIKLIDGLYSETAFNIIMFDRNLDIFQMRLTAATEEARESAKKFIDPYLKNSAAANQGSFLNNYTPSDPSLLAGPLGGGSRIDAAIVAAFEQGADAIFVVSDGAPVIGRVLNEKDRERLNLANQAARDFFAEKITQKEAEKIIKKNATWNDQVKANPLGPFRARIEWVERTKGMSQAQIKELMRSEGREFEPGYGPGVISNEDIMKKLEEVYEKLYKDQGRSKPSIHTLSYQASGGAKDFMEALSDEFKGKFREVEFDN